MKPKHVPFRKIDGIQVNLLDFFCPVFVTLERKKQLGKLQRENSFVSPDVDFLIGHGIGMNNTLAHWAKSFGGSVAAALWWEFSVRD